ncbi:MAG: type II toxin-antitoxin system PemK/MazF family toxin [Acidobacteria bacterium]|nr:MAG: type II toxin-antitoxin system PemK/MazF family toxin [Acidobacteriota bacterium]
MVIRQGEAWWANLSESAGSEAGFHRPVVVQSDRFHRSRIATAVCLPLSSLLRWADAPGHVLLSARPTGRLSSTGCHHLHKCFEMRE